MFSGKIVKSWKFAGSAAVVVILILATAYCSKADSIGVFLGKKVDAAMAAVGSVSIENS